MPHNLAAAMKVVLRFTSIPEMLHKGRTLNTEVAYSEQILEIATLNGAKCELIEDTIGSLEVGKGLT